MQATHNIKKTLIGEGFFNFPEKYCDFKNQTSAI